MESKTPNRPISSTETESQMQRGWFGICGAESTELHQPGVKDNFFEKVKDIFIIPVCYL